MALPFAALFYQMIEQFGVLWELMIENSLKLVHHQSKITLWKSKKVKLVKRTQLFKSVGKWKYFYRVSENRENPYFLSQTCTYTLTCCCCCCSFFISLYKDVRRSQEVVVSVKCKYAFNKPTTYCNV